MAATPVAGGAGFAEGRRPLQPATVESEALKRGVSSCSAVHRQDPSDHGSTSAIVVPPRAPAHSGRRHAPPPPPQQQCHIRREAEVEEVRPSPPHRRPQPPHATVFLGAIRSVFISATTHRRSHPGRHHRPLPSDDPSPASATIPPPRWQRAAGDLLPGGLGKASSQALSADFVLK